MVCTLSSRYSVLQGTFTCRLITDFRGSRSSQNLVAISQRYCRPLLTLKADCIGNNGKYWLLSPGTNSQSEGYSSKWLIWLVCREPLDFDMINMYLKVQVLADAGSCTCILWSVGLRNMHQVLFVCPSYLLLYYM